MSGNEQAWAALIDKYKNLIYSIPVKYHATPQDAADIFQAVCQELFLKLSQLRRIESLRSWLITVTIHESYRWKKKQQRWSNQELDETSEEAASGDAPGAAKAVQHELVEAAEREQMVRESISRLPDRCREMIRLLFYEQPPLPYAEVAQRLGLATGSIGFIRGRCLKRLQQVLEKTGFS
ncbi:MAG: RNA polymerase sigma factor [Terriglobia bacterium]